VIRIEGRTRVAGETSSQKSMMSSKDLEEEFAGRVLGTRCGN
jgi:hypothetical protein